MTNNNNNMSDKNRTTEAKKVEKVKIGEEMKQSYIDYSMSVIIGRALPDVRDGLKPVQRRILYSMHKEGIGSTKSHRKSSSIVGETMGNFHPHGDSAIYDALSRMAQDFSLRAPLVDGQGNFGSMDGDAPAAMRYTEARLSEYGEILLKDLNNHTVDWESNYDGRMEEPEVLPASFPNLLVNGSSGIAVGMSTEIPPHNIGEVIDATIHIINNPDCDIDELLDYVKAPDFPTGGEIILNKGVEKAYKEGKGRIKVRASYEVDEEDNKIIINEVPYPKRKKKSAIVKKIADMAREGEIDGVRDLRDESNRDGIRIVIELKQGAIPELVENKLIKKKILQNNISMINLSLVDGQPKILDLKQTLEEYINHRKNLIQNRTQRRLKEAEDESHILEGKIVALENVEEVVEIIRGEENRKDAISELVENLELTQEQSESIVRMQLGSLTSMEMEEIQKEHEKLEKDIEKYKKILSTEEELLDVVKEELIKVKEEYNQERKTDIVFDEASVSHEDLIPEEDMVVTISDKGYIKRTNSNMFKVQRRSGKGIRGMKSKNGDSINKVFTCSTHDEILFLTNKGNVYSTKCYNIPESGRNSKGSPIHSVLGIDKEDEITQVSCIDREKQDRNLVIATKNGLVKKTPMNEYENIYSSGLKAIELNPDDNIADITVSDEEETLLLTTKNGKAIRFKQEEVRSVSRSSKGVKGIELDEDDYVNSVERIQDEDEYLLTITKNGYGKMSPLDEYRTQSRGGKGYIDIKTDERNGNVINSFVVSDNNSQLFLSSGDSNLIRFEVDEISVSGRNTKGVKMMEASQIVASHLNKLNNKD